jgi:hypothetical protein
MYVLVQQGTAFAHHLPTSSYDFQDPALKLISQPTKQRQHNLACPDRIA